MKSFRVFAVLFVFSVFSRNSEAQHVGDFTLASVTDTSHFTLSSAKGRFVALHFLLKTECPHCIRFTQDYFSKASSLPNVVQVFIKPDTEEEIAAWAQNLEGPEEQYVIYRDPGAKLAKQFEVPDGYAFHGQMVHYPALILLDPNGKEVFRYVGKKNSDRYSFEQLKSKVAELSKGR